jgi:hypothetical protein
LCKSRRDRRFGWRNGQDLEQRAHGVRSGQPRDGSGNLGSLIGIGTRKLLASFFDPDGSQEIRLRNRPIWNGAATTDSMSERREVDVYGKICVTRSSEDILARLAAEGLKRVAVSPPLVTIVRNERRPAVLPNGNADVFGDR